MKFSKPIKVRFDETTDDLRRRLGYGDDTFVGPVALKIGRRWRLKKRTIKFRDVPIQEEDGRTTFLHLWEVI